MIAESSISLTGIKLVGILTTISPITLLSTVWNCLFLPEIDAPVRNSGQLADICDTAKATCLNGNKSLRAD
jgi:hypothetical protein